MSVERDYTITIPLKLWTSDDEKAEVTFSRRLSELLEWFSRHRKDIQDGPLASFDELGDVEILREAKETP